MWLVESGGIQDESHLGDGALTYGSEKVTEAYYNFQIWKAIHATVDYEFVDNPAFNRDRVVQCRSSE